MSQRERAAFRAGGQAYAAMHEGVSITRVNVEGVVFGNDDGLGGTSTRADCLSKIAIRLAGVAAIDRYSFGTAPAGGWLADWNFGARQREDLATVRQLVDQIDPDSDLDVFFLAWSQALDLIADEAVWEAIEFFASVIEHIEVDGIGLAQLVYDREADEQE
jgi:hypothetical protein